MASEKSDVFLNRQDKQANLAAMYNLSPSVGSLVLTLFSATQIISIFSSYSIYTGELGFCSVTKLPSC